MYHVTIETHATPSKYWGRIEFLDGTGILHARDIYEERKGTVNSNALLAIVAALRILKRPCIIDIHTDSEYLASSIINGWVARWKSNDWKNAKGKPVKNEQLWKELMGLLARHSYRFATIEQKGDQSEAYHTIRCKTI